MSVKSNLRRLAVFLVLGSVAAFEAGYAVHVMYTIFQPQKLIAQPFTYDEGLQIDSARDSARRAGLEIGDRLVAVNSAPFVSDVVLANALIHSRPSMTLHVQVERAPDRVVSLDLPLQHESAPRHPFVMFVTSLFLPAFCTLLGIWIVVVRPRELTSWILLGLLMSFSRLIVAPGWQGPFRAFTLTCESILPETLGIWMLWFAMQFPGLSNWRSWSRWLAGTLMLAIAVVVSLDAAVVLGSQIDFSLFAGIGRHYAQLQGLINILLLASLIVFALILILKMRVVGRHSDHYRRLQLIGLGACVGLGPSLLIAIANYIRGSGASSVPKLLEAIGYCMLVVFPVTLAYVFLVHRALGMRAILRDGFRFLSGTERSGLLRELILTSVVATGLYVSRVPTLLAVVVPILFFFVLLKFSLIQSFGIWIDQHLFRESHNAEQLLLETFEPAGRFESTESLMKKLLQRVAMTMQTENVVALLRTGDAFTVHHQVGNRNTHGVSFAVEGPLAGLLRQEFKPLMLYADGPRSSLDQLVGAESNQVRALNTEVMLPMRGTHDLLGIIGLGPRRWDQPYSQMDLRLLSILSNECCLVIENSQLIGRLTEEIHERERKHAEKLAAEETAQAKSDLLAQMSHELRTPLNAILGYSEMLTEEAEEVGATNMVADLGKIHSAGKHLLDLISAVLDMAKLEAGRMQLYLEIFSIERLMRETASIAAPLMTRNKNEFVLDIPHELGAIEADATKLRQVILNLLSNAAKFTSNGTITLRASVERVDDIGWVSLEVSDTGMGMTEDQIAGLCVPFRQADASIARKFGGTGLGLAISRQFCQLMRGDIAIKSRLGHGSVFTVRLPIAVSRYEKALDTEATQPTNLTTSSSVLVIDDDAVVCDLVARFFADLPVRVISSQSGTDGVSKAVLERPSCILLDIIMPDKDGWTVLRELKSDPRVADIPVVVCSIIGDPSFALSLGAAALLSKPVMRSELLRCIVPLLQASEEVPTPSRRDSDFSGGKETATDNGAKLGAKPVVPKLFAVSNPVSPA